MIRYFLAQGDRAGSAVIIEGLKTVTCSHPPPSVQIATIGMRTYCAACKKEGFIAPRGPRRPGTAANGKEWALSGDINICDCNPPPTFYAERGMMVTFTAEEVAQFSGREGGFVHARSSASEDSSHWISFAMREQGSLEGLRCSAHFSDGSIEYGELDRNNKVRFERGNHSSCTSVQFQLNERGNDLVPVVGSLLTLIAD